VAKLLNASLSTFSSFSFIKMHPHQLCSTVEELDQNAPTLFVAEKFFFVFIIVLINVGLPLKKNTRQ